MFGFSLPSLPAAIAQYCQAVCQRVLGTGGPTDWVVAVNAVARALLSAHGANIASPEAQAGMLPFLGGNMSGPGDGDSNFAFVNTIFREVLEWLPLASRLICQAGGLTNGTLTPAQVLAGIVGPPKAHVFDATAMTNFLSDAGKGKAKYGEPSRTPPSRGSTYRLTPSVAPAADAATVQTVCDQDKKTPASVLVTGSLKPAATSESKSARRAHTRRAQNRTPKRSVLLQRTGVKPEQCSHPAANITIKRRSHKLAMSRTLVAK